MKLKHAIWGSVIWTVIGLVASVGLIAYIGTTGSPSGREARAGMAGQGMAFLMGLGYAGLWLPYAFVRGKEKRAAQAEAQEQARRSKRKSRRD